MATIFKIGMGINTKNQSPAKFRGKT